MKVKRKGKKVVVDTVHAGGGVVVDIVDDKPTKQELLERRRAKIARMASENKERNKPGVLPLSEQLTPEEEAAKKRAEKKAKAKPPATKGKKADKGKKGKPAETPKAAIDESGRTVKGPGYVVGIVETILNRLCKATAEKPVTKREIFDLLVKKFPERSQASMMSTINHQVPTYLNYAGHKIHRVEGGFWGERKKEESK